MDLLVIQLKAAIRRTLDAKGVRARVLDKVNRYGEVVIGVILERAAPAPRVGSAGTGAESGAACDEGVQDEREAAAGRARDEDDTVT